MSNCICKNCGMEANSKCPYCRSIFSECEMESILSWIFKHSVKKDRNDNPYLDISYNMKENETEKEAFQNMYYTLTNVIEGKENYPTLEQFCCNHQWEFKDGCKSSIGCGHEGKDL